MIQTTSGEGTPTSRSIVEIPVIDISKLRNGSPEERHAVAMEIGLACEDVGFLVITGHGVPQPIIDAAWQATAEFFDRPLDEKSQFERPQEEYPFGYSRLGGEVLSSGKSAEHAQANGAEAEVRPAAAPDLKEMFSLGPSDPAAGFPPREFPSQPANFERAWTDYYDTLSELARDIMRGFAIALDLGDEHFFERFVDHHASALRALNYPHLDNYQPLPGQLRASAHTDYGTVTILRSDYPGLQVSKDKSPPTWIDVPFVPGAYIVNLGDLMARWTGDRWLSTLHRVINPHQLPRPPPSAAALGEGGSATPASTRRQSMAFFYNVNKDSLITTLPSTKPSKQYEPVIAGDFLLMKHLAATGYK